MKLFFMCVGISGSGKSTWLKDFKKEQIVCPDDIRVELSGDISDQSKNGQVWRLAKDRVNAGLHIAGISVLDATNVTTRNRRGFMKNLPYDTITIGVVFPMVDPQEAFDRIQKDLKKGIVRSDVTLDVIKSQSDRLTQSYDNIVNEFDLVHYIGKENPEEEFVIGTTSKLQDEASAMELLNIMQEMIEESEQGEQ